MSERQRVPVFGACVPGQTYVRRPSAYVLLRDVDGALAVVRTPRGWFLPGGGIDAGERAAEAAMREAREEAGLVVDALRAIGDAIEMVRSDEEQAWFEKVCTFFVASVAGHTSTTEPDHALTWLDPTIALELLTPETHRWALRRLLDEDGRRVDTSPPNR